MSFMDSPARRVLGNKTTNAPIHKQSPLKTTKSTIASQQGLKTYTSVKPPPASLLGQKRSIEEVEDAERVESQEDNSQQSTGTQALSSEESDADDDSMGAVMNSRTTNATEAMSFGPSQPEVAPVESTFELIEDEPSQNTRDTWNAVPLPQNASQPTGLRPLLTNSLSQVSAGMSSFVDFDMSQAADDLQPIEPTTDTKETSKDEAEASPAASDARRQQISAHAEQLRTKLQLAMFKVTTNQTTTPFSRLRTQSRPKSPEPQQLSSSPPSSPAAPRGPSLETRMAIARAKATMQAKKPVPSLSSLPTPSIQPTAYSARTLEPPQTAPSHQLPSSPPQSRHASTDGTSDETPRPAKQSVQHLDIGKATPKTPMQLSSPPGSPEHSKRGNVNTTVERVARDDAERNLTSSTVKGAAADVLMRMMKGREG